MQRTLITLLLILPMLALGQNQFDNTVHDTIPDFWNKSYYMQIRGHQNRIIKSEDKLLYVGLTFENKTQYNFEYFRINDSLFHCIEYYESGNKKSWGNVIITNKIIYTDSLIGFDPTIDKRTLYAHHFRQIFKSGEWNYTSDIKYLFDLGDSWQGNFQDGIKTGIWRHYINGPNELELELNDFSSDSLINKSTKNLIHSISLDKLGTFLTGLWSLSTCESKTPTRMLLYKCNKIDNSYGDDCNNRFGKVNYFAFNAKNIFHRQIGEGCYNYKDGFSNGSWLIEKNNADIFLNLSV